MRRHGILIVVALLGAFALPLAAQEKEAEAQVLEMWDDFDAYLKKARKDLDTLQLQFNGSEKAETKKRIEVAFNQLRKAALERSRSVYSSIERFIDDFPNNVAVRKRRLEDASFDRVPARTRAEDAETLYKLTNDGMYLHKAAELHEKGYDYKAAMKYWKLASEKAETYQVMKDLGEAAMNAMDYAQSRIAFQRAVELATAQRDKQEAQRNSDLAQQYVGFWESEKALREAHTRNDNLPIVEMETDRGTMVIELFEKEAPNTVANFITLVEKGFFDGLSFFRNHAYFMIQGGCPKNSGRGDPGYRIKDEYALPGARKHFPFTLSMANENRPNTNGSQFFVTSTTTHWLNDKHTVFGRLLDGFHVPQVPSLDPLDPQNKAGAFKIKKAVVKRKGKGPYEVEKLPSPTAGQ